MADTQTSGDLMHIRPTLIIGLGGTGGDVILRIRKRFFEKYGSLSEFPIVAYLWLDTDASEKHILARQFQQFISLSDPEKRMTTVPDTTIITEHLKEPNNRHIDSWWYPGLNAFGQMSEGAGQIRPYSRLAFYYHFKDYQNLRGSIKDAAARIRDPFTMQKMMESQTLKELGMLAQVEFNKPTNVYIVCSIAGGTGSGMFLDTAFAVKDLLKDCTTYGFLVLPDHFGTVCNDKMRANAYAALKELNYYKYGVPTFDAEWDPGFPAHVPTPAFDYLYVFDNQNAAGQVTGQQPESQAHVFELLADNVFKDFSHGDFADQKRSARINMKQFMNATFDYKHPRFKQRFIQRWQSLGMSAINVPHARIMTACAYKLAAEIINLWGGLSGVSFNQAELPKTIDERVLPAIGAQEDDRTQKHDILFSLLDGSGNADPGNGKARGLLADLTAWRQGVERDVSHHVYVQQRKRLRDYLDGVTKDELEKQKAEELGPQPEKWGRYPRTMRANLDALTERVKGKIRQQAFAMVDDRHDSITYAVAALNELVEAFKRTIQQLEKKSSDIDTVLQRRQNEATKRLGEISRYEQRHNIDGRKSIILSYLTERYMDAVVGDNQNAGTLRCGLQKRLYAEGIECCKRLIASVHGEERPDGRRQGGLITQLEGLKVDLEGLRQEFLTGYNYFSQKDDDTLSLVLYENGDVDNVYYPGYVKTRDDILNVGNAVLRDLQRSVTGLAEDLAGGRKEQWKRALTSGARKRFARIPYDFNVLKIFFQKFDEQTRKHHLQQIWARSAYWVTPSGEAGAFTLPSQQVMRMIGVPTLGADLSPAEAGELEQWTQKLKDQIVRDISPNVKFYNVPEPGEILFYQEAGGFPINYVSRIAELRKTYLKLYTAGEPLHIDCHDKKFPDITIFTPRERQALEEAYECYLFGCIFDTLNYTSGEYIWMKRDGFRSRPYPLGDRHMLLVKLSTDDAIRGELYEMLKKKRDEHMGRGTLDDVAAYCALLDAYKVEAWGEDWGKQQDEDQLDFDSMMILKAIQDEEKRVMSSPVAVGNPDGLMKRVQAMSQNPAQFARKREDGKWALAAPAPA